MHKTVQFSGGSGGAVNFWWVQGKAHAETEDAKTLKAPLIVSSEGMLENGSLIGLRFWRSVSSEDTFMTQYLSGWSQKAVAAQQLLCFMNTESLKYLLWITHVTFGRICLFVKIWCYLEFTYWCPLLLILVKLWLTKQSYFFSLVPKPLWDVGLITLKTYNSDSSWK